MPGLNSVDGISSGLNTTEIIDTIMASERQTAVLLEQRQAEKQAIITTYQALQAKMLGLSAKVAALTKSSTYDAASINVSDDTILSAVANGKVSTGTYDIRVLAVARNHQIASQGFDSQSLSSFGTGEIRLAVGDAGETVITIDSSNNSLIGIKQAINNAGAGVTASIVNDGSSANSYRLLLSADNSGRANDISITSNLTGGSNLNYSTAVFDTPEANLVDGATTSQISLGATAAFTGNENKIYTLTVDGGGSDELTVGSDLITINWTDGTNSGSIVLDEADTEIELFGAGAEGLKVSFSAGTLHDGDTFDVATFAPLLQDAADARITVGSSGGSGSPITITSDTNSFIDVLGGLNLAVMQPTAAGESVTVTAGPDTQAVKDNIQAFIDAYNDMVEFIDEQNTYDTEKEEAGYLFGEYTVWTLQSSVRNLMSSRVAGLTGQFNHLYSIGIRSQTDGKLYITDSSRFNNAIENNLEDVARLFTDAGQSSLSSVEFVSAGSSKLHGKTVDVDITAAATHGGLNGTSIQEPSASGLTLDDTNNRLTLKVDGISSDTLYLTNRQYTSGTDLAREVQRQIDNDEKIGNRGLAVQWEDQGGGYGRLVFQSSTYGSGSKVEIGQSLPSSAFALLGLDNGTTVTGQDVQGTINGEEAVGSGQFLTGKSGNATTDGLQLKVVLDESQVIEGAESTITLTRGLAAGLNQLVNSYTESDGGTIEGRIAGFTKEIETLAGQVTRIDDRLADRREELYAQFLEMETILSQLDSESSYLSSMSTQMNANWKHLSS